MGVQYAFRADCGLGWEEAQGTCGQVGDLVAVGVDQRTGEILAVGLDAQLARVHGVVDQQLNPHQTPRVVHT